MKPRFFTRQNLPPENLAVDRIRGNACPFCGHEYVQNDCAAEINSGYAYQEVFCERAEDELGPECQPWMEIYKLEGWNHE